MQDIVFKDRYYGFSQFESFPIIACFSGQRLDLSLEENLRNFLKGLGIDLKNLVRLKQVHSGSIHIADSRDKGRMIPKRDALITKEKNLPLAVFTADCLSVFLYDSKNHVIGLIHAGRRGTEKEISKKTVLKILQTFKADPKFFYIGFGPAIRSCCYEMDLIRLNFDQLTKLGVKRENIFDSGICTSCNNDEFLSYRKEGISSGRMISVMMLL